MISQFPPRLFTRVFLNVTLGVFAAALPVRSAGQAFIVENSQPKASIVIAEQPTRMQKLAAEELQHYVQKMTGAALSIGSQPSAELPVRIYVGESEFTKDLGLKTDDLAHGAYRIQSGDGYLALLGNDANFFMDKPGDAGAVFPAHRREREPAAEAWREKHGEMWGTPFSSAFKAYNPELGVWAVDEFGSLNAVYDFLRWLGVRWYMPGDFGEVCPTMTSIPVPTIDETVRPEWSERDIRFGSCRPYQVGAAEMLWQLRLGLHPLKEKIGGHGTKFLLEMEWVKQHKPEFYALYGSERATAGHGKPCYSSQELLDSALDFSRLMFDDYHMDTVSLMPTDAYGAFCQCKRCQGKDTPERGYRGIMSDYVWSFMNRAAAEIAKTHPDKHIMNYSYNTYREPPEDIETFHPNLRVGICGPRKTFRDPNKKAMYLNTRQGFLEKLPAGKISLWEYYNLGSGMPDVFPQIIAEDLKWLKGKIDGTMIEFNRGKRVSAKDPAPDERLATSHLNLWLTARLWWNPDADQLWWTQGRDAEALLDEYYQKFYGPAAEDMKAFVEFCEVNVPLMTVKPEPIDHAFTLIENARKAASEHNLYARRVQLVIDYMQPLKTVRENLAVGRENNPIATFAERNEAAFELDGRLDDAFWQGLPTYELKHVETGEDVDNQTTFKVAWAGDSLYFAVRCEEENMEGLVIPATKDGDNTIFDGDSIELQLETATHAYYQISIDPKGHVNDLDRPDATMIGRTGPYETKWESEIEVATRRGEDFWTVELRVPVWGSAQEEILPYSGVSGDKPTRDAPWYFNLCRIRKAGGGRAFHAYSPTGENGFHYRRKFARLVPEE